MDPFRRVSAAIAASAFALAAAPALAADSPACPDTSNPVCASDARTYANACWARFAGVSVSYSGACLSVPVGDAEKVDRAADLFLAKVFFTTVDLDAKARGYVATLARFDAVAADGSLSPATRSALRRIRARFAEKGQKYLQSHFRTQAENWFRLHLSSAAPQPGVGDNYAPTRFTWGPMRRDGSRLYATVEVAYESRLEELSSSFDVAFDRGTLRTLPVVSAGKEIALRKGVLARASGSDVLFKVETFVDSPCPEGAWCFWRGQSVEAAWYKGGDVRRTSDGGEAFGYRLEIVDTDYKTYAKVKLWPSEWQ